MGSGDRTGEEEEEEEGGGGERIAGARLRHGGVRIGIFLLDSFGVRRKRAYIFRFSGCNNGPGGDEAPSGISANVQPLLILSGIYFKIIDKVNEYEVTRHE